MVAYVLTYSFGFTGQAVHEWLGLGIAVALVVHLALHWPWIMRATRRLLRSGTRRPMLWSVNVVLLLSMTLCVLSGIYVSGVALPALGLADPGGAASFAFWRRLHHITASVTLLAVPIHLALDWRWLVSVGRRLFTRRPVEPVR